MDFTTNLTGSHDADQGVSVSALSVLHDGTILLVGDSGLYRLNGSELSKELTFTNTHQEIPIDDGEGVYHWSWDPSKVLVLDDGSFFISGAFGGIYLLPEDQSGQWAFASLDEEFGEPVTW